MNAKVTISSLETAKRLLVPFKFKPVIGKSLKIELTGGVDNRDAFGNIIEIPGTPDPQSAAGRKTGLRTLGLVEIEIYQPTTTASTLASRF